jgi:hypothetical protein
VQQLPVTAAKLRAVHEWETYVNRIGTLAMAGFIQRPGVVLAAASTLNVSKSVTIHAAGGGACAKAKDVNELDSWNPAGAQDELVVDSIH